MYCIVIGTVSKEHGDRASLLRLLDQFVEHRSSEDEYTIFGSSETSPVIFQSYDMTSEESISLRDDIDKTSADMIMTILPKTLTDKRQPLLPFNVGQLGLILISGEINGAIKEPDTDCYHVVKGSSCQTTVPSDETVRDARDRVIGRKSILSTYATTNVTVVLSNGDIRTLQ